MKKILTLLGSIGLVATSSAAVIACTDKQEAVSDAALKALAEKWKVEWVANIEIEETKTAEEIKSLFISTFINELSSKYEMKLDLVTENIVTKITVGNVIIWNDKKLDEEKINEVKNVTQQQEIVITVKNIEFKFNIIINIKSTPKIDN